MSEWVKRIEWWIEAVVWGLLTFCEKLLYDLYLGVILSVSMLYGIFSILWAFVLYGTYTILWEAVDMRLNVFL